MRLLFVKEAMSWPRSSGHDVHCYYMMEALAGLGHDVALITAADPVPEAIAGLPLSLQRSFSSAPADDGEALQLTRMQERFRSYWGIDRGRIRVVARTASEFEADAVIVVGLNVLPYLGAVTGCVRVWYAADEWVWHHLSQVRLFHRSTWGEVKPALLKGLYERAYQSLLDRVWVVTDRDRSAMRWAGGARTIDVIPNGVDGNHYRPVAVAELERTCTFWGRLDFGPNIQALDWFCRQVWPLVRQHVPDARFVIYGFSPGPAVHAMTRLHGVELIADVPDLRSEVARHQAVVLPFVSGGGIKNKLLEAASMAKAIVCAPRACNGLQMDCDLPLLLARKPAQWLSHLKMLWHDAALRSRLGGRARRWVSERHSWQAAALAAVRALEQSMVRGA